MILRQTKQRLTFEDFVRVTAFAVPWRVAVLCEVAEFQIADCESDDRRLVQLTCDCGGEWKHLGQLVELVILLAASRPGRVTRLLFAQFQNAVE